MVSLNKKHGHIINNGKILYKEKIQEGVYVVVVSLYGQYLKDNYGDSSHVCIKGVVTNGSMHTWSNGVISFEEAEGYGWEDVNENEQFRPLKRFTTKDGFPVYEHLTLEKSFEQNGVKNVKKKHRFIYWVVEIPEIKLLDFAIRGT